MKKVISLVFVLLLIPALAHADEQVYTAGDGQVVNIKVSKHELNRLGMFGHARLTKLWGATGLLDIQKDVQSGEVFFRPSKEAPRMFSFFVRDQYGNTYTILATEFDVPSQTIMIKPKSKRKLFTSNNTYEDEALPLVTSVKRLMKAMALGKTLPDYDRDQLKQTVPLWKETNIILEDEYTGTRFIGDVYSVKNISKKQIRFSESEFFNFGKHVQAVALERLILPKNGLTYVYVVRRAPKPDGEDW